MIIAVSGTPGTGKTSVSQELGKILGWKVISLNDFARDRKCISGYDNKRKCDIVDIEKLKKEIRNVKEKNFIIESHYAHEMDADVFIILRTKPAELRKRGVGKGWKKEKTEENVLAEIMDVCLTEAMEQGKKVYEIDTTGRKPKEVAREIASLLDLA